MVACLLGCLLCFARCSPILGRTTNFSTAALLSGSPVHWRTFLESPFSSAPDSSTSAVSLAALPSLLGFWAHLTTRTVSLGRCVCAIFECHYRTRNRHCNIMSVNCAGVSLAQWIRTRQESQVRQGVYEESKTLSLVSLSPRLVLSQPGCTAALTFASCQLPSVEARLLTSCMQAS